MKCEKCMFSRTVTSENGSHPVCCLSEEEARECILGITDHYYSLIDRKEKNKEGE